MKRIAFMIGVLCLMAGLFPPAARAQTLTLRYLKSAAANEQSCGIQESELNKAARMLTKALKKSGMDVQLGFVQFAGAKPSGDLASPLGLWINDKPVENWLHAEIVKTSSADCPDVKVDATLYHVIPADLIVKAGMAAAQNVKTTHVDRTVKSPAN